MVSMPALKLAQAWQAIKTMRNDHYSGDPLRISECTNNWSFFISEGKEIALISCSMITTYI